MENQQFDGLTKDGLIGDMLYAGALSYFAANDMNLQMINKGKQALSYRLPSFGTFSTDLDSVYSFGVPRQVEMSGIMVDMDVVNQSVWTKDNDAQLVKTVVQQIGMQTSAWEHKIPEMLFSSEEYPGEAVSAMKALGIAAAEGQRIYQITKDNVDVVLPTLNIGSEVKREIKDSVAVGKVATVSQNNITVGSWTGVGYIIADADTGAGAYRISGGSNGNKYSSTKYVGTFLGFLYAACSIFLHTAVLSQWIIFGLALQLIFLISAIKIMLVLNEVGGKKEALTFAAAFVTGMLMFTGIPGISGIYGFAVVNHFLPFLIGFMAWEALG